METLKTLHINVVDKVATYQKRDGNIVCGNSDYQIKFTFDPEWDAHPKKTARFIWGGKHYDKDFTGDTCPVPKLRNTTEVEVGVFAGDLNTTTSAVIPARLSILCKGSTPSLENDIDYANEAKEAAERAAEEAREEVTRLVGELGVVQRTGDSPTAVMSQKVTTSYLSQHDKRLTNLELGLPPECFLTDSGVAYVKHVPLNALPSALVGKIGGMTYDDGDTLKSAKPTALKITGANLFNDVEWFASHGFSDEGDYWNCKSKNEICFTNTTRRSGSMYINVVAKSDLSPHNSVMYLIVYYTDGTADVGCDVIPSTDFVNLSMITDASKTVDNVLWTYGSGGEYRLKGVSMSFVDGGGYIPYTETSFPIPVEIQNLDGYGEGLSADCHNYIDWDKKQFVKRVGKVDMGTLNWEYEPTSAIFYAPVNGMPWAGAVLCALYRKADNSSDLMATDKSILAYYSYYENAVNVHDSAYTDAATFKNAMSGVTLCYELATPEVTDISDLLSVDNYIGVEGGGTITAVNEHEYAVPTEITYQIKGAAV